MGLPQQAYGDIGTSVSLSNSNPFPSPLYSGCGGLTPPPAANPDFEQQIVDLVNGARLNQGLPPLKRADPLDNSSLYHAIDMAQDNYFHHDTYDLVGGILTPVCAWYQRLASYYSNWMYLAENIAVGYTDPTSVMNGWMNSTGHRDAILNDVAWEMGVGYYSGGYWGNYWVLDFGKRNGVYPLVINGDAATTTSRKVAVNIYGDFSQMRLKNDNGAFGSWQPFQNQFSWRMDCGVGNHTVTAELRTSTGTILSTSDSIQLTISGCPYLGGMPDTISFLYSQAEDNIFYPSSFTVIPANTVTDDAISWSLSEFGTWFNVTPTTGVTPDSFQIIPTGIESPGIHTGSITITVTSPSTTEGTPKIINLRLIVVAYPLYKIYSSIIRR